MSEPLPAYTTITKRGNRITYELTPAEAKIIEWIRSGANNGCDWVGTIRYVSGPGMYQMADHVNRGQVSNRA
jgi:hypothetical protein